MQLMKYMCRTTHTFIQACKLIVNFVNILFFPPFRSKQTFVLVLSPQNAMQHIQFNQKLNTSFDISCGMEVTFHNCEKFTPSFLSKSLTTKGKINTALY